MMISCLHTFANPKAIKKSNGEKNFETTSQERDFQTLFSEIVTNTLPKEKVYLHLDNTSYYKDDTLWFSAYLVNSDGNTPDAESSTLYVDLLNPGGEIIATNVLKVENGRAHGNFRINCTPFYSGFFEIRAYTKYMMNFGPETIFSRVIPVFDNPKKEGDYQKHSMRTFGSGKYQYKRKFPEKRKNINVRFYPEGGRLIRGVPIKVAFEATDKGGHPLDVQGSVLSSAHDTVAYFRTEHEGKGTFTVIPDGKPMMAVVENNGSTKKFALPDPYLDGYSITVDNVSNPDSIFVIVRRAGEYSRKDTVGVALTDHGVMKVYSALASTFMNPVRLPFDRNSLSAGVAEVTLINAAGKKIAERMFFNAPDSAMFVDMKYEFDKKDYQPYEAVNLTVSLSDLEGIPIRSPFSMSVRDGNDETSWNRNIMTDMLLMSDIKGYVANPEYYFEVADSIHRSHLDLLMLVQGWRKYPWESLKENRRDELRFRPETDGIEIAGTVRSLTNKKMADVDVTAFLMKGDREEDKSIPPMNMTRTDSIGRFSFTANIQDRWSLILNTTRNNKLIDSQISLDRKFVPQPRRYHPYEMEISFMSKHDNLNKESNDNSDTSSVPDEADDIKLPLSPDGTSIWLDEIEVKAKRSWLDDARAQARKRSVAYYDVDDEVNNLRDNGAYIDMECDIHKLIKKVNPNFTTEIYFGEEELRYKGKAPLIVVDYERLAGPLAEDYYRYKDVKLESIKSISVSEDASLKGKYCWNLMSMFEADKAYGCVVMIETYPDGRIMVDGGKGIRKTSVHGYDVPQEFYSPDYSVMPLEKDYRRTLYWNPAVIPDENGKATVRFYNNSDCSNFKVDMQTVTPTGALGSTYYNNTSVIFFEFINGS
ncbi:MAG: hypothetical protein K2K75_14410 [Muribaculaceae bacterium]|nr:hypothetical protein [Muribaculaceae bacterium]